MRRVAGSTESTFRPLSLRTGVTAALSLWSHRTWSSSRFRPVAGWVEVGKSGSACPGGSVAEIRSMWHRA